ncbi:MAG: hypothetical protein AAF604_02950 [Acidobacteriota bacterium]
MTAPSAHLTCPQCGGDNDLLSGVALAVCAYCDATLFVDRSGLVLHYGLPRLIDQRSAEQSLRRWMAGNETVKNLDRLAKVEEQAAVRFPMWFFRRRSAAGESTLVEPAAPTPISQLAEIEVPVGKLETWVPEEGVETVDATVPLETARSWIPEGGREEVAETALVHVPLWRFRYRYDDQSYVALVEGSTGTVLASIFPAKAESPFYLVAGLGLFLFGAEGLLISNLALKAVVYGITAVPMVAIAYLVARKV